MAPRPPAVGPEWRGEIRHVHPSDLRGGANHRLGAGRRLAGQYGAGAGSARADQRQRRRTHQPSHAQARDRDGRGAGAGRRRPRCPGQRGGDAAGQRRPLHRRSAGDRRGRRTFPGQGQVRDRPGHGLFWRRHGRLPGRQRRERDLDAAQKPLLAFGGGRRRTVPARHFRQDPCRTPDRQALRI